MRIDGRALMIQPGDLTLLAAGQRYSYDMSRSGHHLCVHFHPAEGDAGPAADAASDPVALPAHRRLGPQRDIAYRKLLSVIRWHAAAHRSPPAGPAASALLLEVLLWVGQEHLAEQSGGVSRADAAVERVAELVEQHLDQPISVPEIADIVGLSQNHLARRFRQVYGMTINRYMLTRRITLAEHLLVTTNLPIKQIASRVGFPSAQHFNKQFRHLAGRSPSEVRTEGR
jgi:AraC family transcriptional regulator